MNAYDFDKTIFHGDSSARFYQYCLWRTPKMLLRLPKLIWGALFILPRDKQRFKEETFGFLNDLKDPEAMVNAFWAKNKCRIKRFYAKTHRPDDLVASASPEFLLKPIMKELGISRLIASPVDIRTGKYSGSNCHGEEKVRRFNKEYPGETIQDFYSDSHADDPMARIAKTAWQVKNEAISPWDWSKARK